MTTYVPVAWPSVPLDDPRSLQSNDPAGTSCFVRYGGGYRASASDTYDRSVDREDDLSARYAKFARVHLETTVVRGMSAIDWEFEFDKAGVRRHARGVYWIAQGHEYFVYASAPVPLWQQTQPILDVMLERSTP